MQQGGNDCHGHPDHTEAVALAGRFRMREAAQRQDEQDGGDEVGEGGQAGGHRYLPYCRRLNIDSMRCVTRNPPKMFTDASVTAMKPNATDHHDVPRPVASIAPTMITEE